MVPLLIGASWLLVVSLVLGLCAAARDGDLQQDPSRSAAVRQPVRPGCGAPAIQSREVNLTAGADVERIAG